MSLACVGSTRSVPATLGLPPLAACVLSPSTLLGLQAALQGAGPELPALPRPKPLRFRFLGTPQRRRLICACRFDPSPAEAAQAARSLRSALSPGAMRLIPSWVPASVSGRASGVCLVSLLGILSLDTTLLADVNHPESQNSLV